MHTRGATPNENKAYANASMVSIEFSLTDLIRYVSSHLSAG